MKHSIISKSNIPESQTDKSLIINSNLSNEVDLILSENT